jgi:ubiquinone/menaquinone biosynthesis C-methylase UbiE
MKQGTGPRILAGALNRLMRGFFYHLYHGLASCYDLVAEVVSLGRWNAWIKSVIPFIHGRRVLELGHGPGHLQEFLMARAPNLSVGLDESAQMGFLARGRLRSTGNHKVNLTRGVAQRLPFAAESFDTVVATFPSDCMFDALTLSEVRRVLPDPGQIVILPAAWIIGRGLTDRLAAWTFRITRQVPPFPPERAGQKLRVLLEGAGFQTEFKTIEVGSSIVLLVVASG